MTGFDFFPFGGLRAAAPKRPGPCAGGVASSGDDSSIFLLSRRLAQSLGLRLGGAQRLADKLLGQHQLGLVEIAQFHARQFFLVRAGVGPLQNEDGVAAFPFDGADRTAKSLAAAIVRPAQFYARVHADGPAEIRDACQRTVDAGRGNLQPVGRRNRIFDVERRRQRVVDRLAIVDGQRSVRPLGHDLDRHPLSGHDLDPHEAKIHRNKDWPRHGGDARGHAGLFDQSRLIQRRVENSIKSWSCDGVVSLKWSIRKSPIGRTGGMKTKKSGSRLGPTPARPFYRP